jgi:hypothetical protein
MTRLIGCDRCHTTEPLDEAIRRGAWTTVSVTTLTWDRCNSGPCTEVCPNCLTAAESEVRQEADEVPF